MRFGNITRHFIGTAAAAALFAAGAAQAADDKGAVQGVVSDVSGQPVAGAFVKLKNDERRLTFMVISQEQGRFEAKDLPPGQYRVQGVGGGYQSAWFNNVSVGASGEGAKVGLSLSERQASKDPNSLPDGVGKELVAEKCGSCHDLRR